MRFETSLKHKHTRRVVNSRCRLNAVHRWNWVPSSDWLHCLLAFS